MEAASRFIHERGRDCRIYDMQLWSRIKRMNEIKVKASAFNLPEVRCDLCGRSVPLQRPEVQFWHKTTKGHLICIGCAINNFPAVLDQLLENMPTIEAGTQIH